MKNALKWQTSQGSSVSQKVTELYSRIIKDKILPSDSSYPIDDYLSELYQLQENIKTLENKKKDLLEKQRTANNSNEAKKLTKFCEKALKYINSLSENYSSRRDFLLYCCKEKLISEVYTNIKNIDLEATSENQQKILEYEFSSDLKEIFALQKQQDYEDPNNQWQHIRLELDDSSQTSQTFSNYQAENFGQALNPSTANVTTCSDFKELKIDAQVTKVDIRRPWLNQDIFFESMVGVQNMNKY